MFYIGKYNLLFAVLLPLFFSQNSYEQKNTTKKSESEGSKIIKIEKSKPYPDNRPQAEYRINADDAGVVLKHGSGPDNCDIYGARDIWVWQDKNTYYMHYDGAGPRGWLTCLAESKDLQSWITRGSVLDFGNGDSDDCASASYGTTFLENGKWHMFYLGTPHCSPAPNMIPAFPYLTMKAESNSPTGPWKKRYDVTPFKPKAKTYYTATASPGQIIKQGNTYLMFFSASTKHTVKRTIGIARTRNLDSAWIIDNEPIVPLDEQIENTSLYFEPSNNTWFLFTNHIGLKTELEYTDAIWVYWTKDLNKWDAKNKAIVLDSNNCKWSKHIIGLPSVIKVDNKLAIFYDGNISPKLPLGGKSHMNRDIGIVWLKLPILLPENE